MHYLEPLYIMIIYVINMSLNDPYVSDLYSRNSHARKISKRMTMICTVTPQAPHAAIFLNIVNS